MEFANFIEVAIAYYKDKTQEELFEKFKVESYLLLKAEAEARWTIARENIEAMAKLRIELQKFKFTYNKISGVCGNIATVDEYIREIEQKIKKLSYEKNNIR